MAERYCPRCEQSKDTVLFYTRRGNNASSYCIDCVCESAKQRQRSLKVKCVEYKGGKCQRCGYNKCIWALEFHHRDRTKKAFGIANRIKSFDKNPAVKEELDKCDMLCANCHREVESEM
jgi:hypothetical protein